MPHEHLRSLAHIKELGNYALDIDTRVNGRTVVQESWTPEEIVLNRVRLYWLSRGVEVHDDGSLSVQIPRQAAWLRDEAGSIVGFIGPPHYVGRLPPAPVFDGSFQWPAVEVF